MRNKDSLKAELAEINKDLAKALLVEGFDDFDKSLLRLRADVRRTVARWLHTDEYGKRAEVPDIAASLFSVARDKMYAALTTLTDDKLKRLEVLHGMEKGTVRYLTERGVLPTLEELEALKQAQIQEQARRVSPGLLDASGRPIVKH